MDDKARFRELALKAAYGLPRFTRFLDPAEIPEAEAEARAAGIRLALDGGWEDAERRMACFYADEPPEAFPVAILRVAWNPRFGALTHRDLLGALMGLGIERNTLGDLCPGQDKGTFFLFCTEEMADYISGHLTSAGRTAVTVSRTSSAAPAPPEGTHLRVTVQAPRLDAVLAAGFRLSRAEAQRRIAQGLVRHNHQPELRGDRRVEAGDLLSVRGCGRLRIVQLQGETRKGRTGLLLFRYGR